MTGLKMIPLQVFYFNTEIFKNVYIFFDLFLYKYLINVGGRLSIPFRHCALIPLSFLSFASIL